MTPSHLHLCISMCMYYHVFPLHSPNANFNVPATRFCVQSDRSDTCTGKDEKKGERWAVSGATEPCDTYWSAPRCLHVLRSMPSDFSAKVLGQGQRSTSGRVSESCPKILKKSARNLRKGKQQELHEFTWLWKVKNSTFPNVGNRKTPPFRAGGKSDPLENQLYKSTTKHHVNLIRVNDIILHRWRSQSQGTNLSRFQHFQKVVTPHWTSIHWFDQKSILFWWPNAGF